MFGTWQMVSGKVEPEEKAYQTALREIYEETGLVPYALHVGDAVETFYTQTYDKIMFLPVFVAFVKEMDVQLSHKEHDAYEWLPFQEAKNRLVWAEQKRAITHVHEHFVLQKPNPLLEIDLSCSQRTM